MRTNIALTSDIYIKLKRVAFNLNIPIGTLISLMVVNVMQENNLKAEKRNKIGNRKTDKKINITLSDDLYTDKIMTLLQKYERYTLRELVFDCIELELSEFDNILKAQAEDANHKNTVTKRIKALGTKKGKANKDTLKRYETKAPIEIYLVKKADSTGVSISALKKYYIGKETNRIIGKYENEFDLFDNPEYYV